MRLHEWHAARIHPDRPEHTEAVALYRSATTFQAARLKKLIAADKSTWLTEQALEV